ncbi:MAG: hypothetical protein ACI8W3_002034, partial [Myxococcota bacterium]
EVETRIVTHVGEALEIARVGELVEHDHTGVGFSQRESRVVGADEAGAAGNEEGIHYEFTNCSLMVLHSVVVSVVHSQVAIRACTGPDLPCVGNPAPRSNIVSSLRGANSSLRLFEAFHLCGEIACADLFDGLASCGLTRFVPKYRVKDTHPISR